MGCIQKVALSGHGKQPTAGLPMLLVETTNDAQVTAGGVNTTEVSAETLASKHTPGLFFCGEMLDVDGPCGGYNLQWAWSSGMCAGEHAAEYSLQ